MNYRLRPSEITFLYEGCKRCFYLSVVHNIPQPSIPMPAIFTRIATLLKRRYDLRDTKDLVNDLPAGKLSYGERYVRSSVIRLPGLEASCYISGRVDMVATFDDKSYGVIDFKTGSAKEENSALFGRQLHAYAYALEHPEVGALSLRPVVKLGLAYFYPSSISQPSLGRVSYDAEIQWVPIDKSEESFLNFMREVLELLSSPEPPPLNPSCQWCAYIDRIGATFGE